MSLSLVPPTRWNPSTHPETEGETCDEPSPEGQVVTQDLPGALRKGALGCVPDIRCRALYAGPIDDHEIEPGENLKQGDQDTAHHHKDLAQLLGRKPQGESDDTAEADSPERFGQEVVPVLHDDPPTAGGPLDLGQSRPELLGPLLEELPLWLQRSVLDDEFTSEDHRSSPRKFVGRPIG